MSYLKYKANEENLKKRYDNGVPLSVEPIDPADVYYTDGDASASVCKIVFATRKTIYIPQLIYNVSEQDKNIISEWIDYVNQGLNGRK
jgi:hypothetical protein